MITILEKSSGTWSEQEVNNIAQANVEVETLPAKPNRLVAMNKPPDGKTFQQILGHTDFESREAEYPERWK